jgi:hypothetical protein
MNGNVLHLSSQDKSLWNAENLFRNSFLSGALWQQPVNRLQKIKMNFFNRSQTV